MTRLFVACCLAAVAIGTAASAAGPAEVAVEPADLTKRKDLIGRSVTRRGPCSVLPVPRWSGL